MGTLLKFQIGLVAFVVVATYLIGKSAIGEIPAVVAAVGTAINPNDNANIVNRGVTSVGVALTGNSGWSLGGAIYDWTHDPIYPDVR